MCTGVSKGLGRGMSYTVTFCMKDLRGTFNMRLDVVLSSVWGRSRTWGQLSNNHRVLSDIGCGDVVVASRWNRWAVRGLCSVGKWRRRH